MNPKRKYGYSYDGLNRITAAYYQVPGTVVPRADTYSTSYSYDSNGNLLTLQRNGNEAGVSGVIGIDDLIYTYDKGNKLQNVWDKEGYSAGYNDRHPNQQIPDFEYDDYGNLVLDRDKEIQEIRYNHLNLPTKISFTSNREISYFYDASGVKIKKEVDDGTQINTTAYRDGFQYSRYVKTTLQSSGYDFNYVFNHTDHLGNIRLRYTQHPETGDLEILQQDHYYPFGLKHEGYNNEHFVFSLENNDGITLVPATLAEGDGYKYKFNQKELEEELGLNTYAFGWRDYDPAIGRFNKLDRFSEKYYSKTPYGYTGNNPVLVNDIQGDSLWISFGNRNQHRALYEDGQLLNADGSRYEGAGVKVKKDGSVKIKNSFLKSAVGALNEISQAEGEIGTDVISTLQSSENNFTIQFGGNRFGANQPGESPNININDAQAYQGQIQGSGPVGDGPPSTTIGTGGTIYWNPNSTQSYITLNGTSTAN